ncbi:MAG: hypothetical protein JW894_06090 [Bacteroidales bacterium]|nr:hypothetical protein [Bacteroidales bacterium]
MKTTAKWISENNYILNNSKNLNIAISDPVNQESNNEINCFDLVLMGFTGCITAEFKKQITRRHIIIQDLETELRIINYSDKIHPSFSLQVISKVKSAAKKEVLEECMKQALSSSLIGILFKNSGIKIETQIFLTSPVKYSKV